MVYFYGRFPPKTDASLGGRLSKRKSYRSSWRRERRDNRLGINQRKRHTSWPAIATVFDRYQNRYDFSLQNNIQAKISSANHNTSGSDIENDSKSNHHLNTFTPISSRFIMSTIPLNPMKICSFIMPITNEKINKMNENINLNSVNKYDMSKDLQQQPTTI